MQRYELFSFVTLSNCYFYLRKKITLFVNKAHPLKDVKKTHHTGTMK